ncbi:hypothetical protein [Kitasatospora sp. NPDC057015]|uniref:hypothetical protein n=1 Tax=Kitasatospora sp. NPDC057015 TaxID=3346001 RepID=UPI003637F170
MTKHIGWDERLSVKADGKGLVRHAGVVLLRKCADRVGLTSGLSRVLPRGFGAGWLDRGTVVIALAVAIVLGATNLAEAEQLQAHQSEVFGAPTSDSATRRTLNALDEPLLGRVAKARAKVRRQVWGLLALRPVGFPGSASPASG